VSKPAIEVRGVRYRYTASDPGWVLQGLDLCVEAGEYLLICGASGSGKSTLCRLLNGLIPHFYDGIMEGQVRVNGVDTRESSVGELFGHVGTVFQNPTAQLFNHTVAGELAFGLESLGLPPEAIARQIKGTASRLEMDHLLEQKPHQLSGGEQQLVAIAAAVACQPQVLVLDEPYASLDPANVGRVREALRQIHRDGTAVIVVEHRLEHAVADADRMVVLHGGRIASNGPPRTVLAEDIEAFGLNLPATARVARALDLREVPLTVGELATAVNGRRPPPEALWRPKTPAHPGAEPVLQVENVTFAFGDTPALQDVNLTVSRSECLALVGANGSGKTTLVKHFDGLHHPQRGQVLVLGQDTRKTKTSRLAAHVGLAFQNANSQFFKFQVQDEIEVGARALKRYDEKWLRELITLFRLEPLLARSPYRLSEGEKKRVAFASALAPKPEILVLDEPTTGQDWPFRQALGEMLGDLRARGQSVILVTHDLEFAEQCADRWVLMSEGQVVSEGRPKEVMGDAAAMCQARLEPTQSFRICQALTKG
jgi:energy-coupling factor transporter ATP-binding protein EcfA2